MTNPVDLFTGYTITDGVYLLSIINDEFEKAYLTSREKENWLINNETLMTLPNVSKTNPNYKLWQMRKDTLLRFDKYIASKNQSIKILDVGCGNGWFTNFLSLNKNCELVCGIDINLQELKQAASVFKNPKLCWAYGDIFISSIPTQHFDIITLNASFQYFDNPQKTLEQLFQFLKPKGEIHILDTSFYTLEEVNAARKRSADYFTTQQNENMKQFYHHHTFASLSQWDYQILYKPSRVANRIGSLFCCHKSPFPWLLIKKSNQ